MMSLFTMQIFAQNKEYVTFFFGKVKNSDVENHIKNEKLTFAKVHEDRIKRGEIIGWDMWKLVSPEDTKGETTFLYATIYSDIEKANLWSKNPQEYIKRVAGANPENFTKLVNTVVSDYTGTKNIVTVVKANDAANGKYDSKGNNFNIKYVVLNSMQVDPYRGSEYEKFAGETLKPNRKQNEKLQGWSLHKVLNVYGKNKINYYTVDFYSSLKDIYELRERTSSNTEENIKTMNEYDKLRSLMNADIFELIDYRR